MPTATYDLIASNVLGSNTSTVTFSSIPGTYRDLVVVIEAKYYTTGNLALCGQINSDSGSNYILAIMESNGSTNSATGTTRARLDFSWNYNALYGDNSGLFIINYLDYSATNKHKIVLSRNNQTSNAVNAVAHKWGNTSAITTLSFFPEVNQFLSGSTFHLYGIVS